MLKALFTGVLFIGINTNAATLSVPATIAQGEIAEGTTTAGATITINGGPVPVTDNGTFLLAAGRDATGSLTINAVDETGKTSKTIPITKASWKIENIKGLAKKYVAPPASVTKRIQSDNRKLGKARRIVDPTPYFTQGTIKRGFIKPVQNARISGVFGSQRVLNGTPKSPHKGTDFAAPTGTPIVSPAPGKVTMVVDDMYYTGGTITVDHGHGLNTVYAHMHSIDVVEGQEVAQGEQLGTVGKTGRATGPHLHFGATLRRVHVDPVYLFDL